MQETLPRNINTTFVQEVTPEVETLILKVHSRCNIRCYPDDEDGTACYMYKEDTEYQRHEMAMTLDTVAAAAERLGDDARTHHSRRKVVIFHGGEPLLQHPEFFENAINMFLDELPDTTELRTGVETNGTRLTTDYLDVFRKYGTRVGISLDGDREANKHRVYANGRETFDETMRGVELIRRARYAHLFSGILAVANIENEPLRTYTFLRDLLTEGPIREAPGKPGLDFLLPLGGWDEPPYENEAQRLSKPYATWMFPIARQWIEHDREALTLRGTQTIINKIAGRPSNLDAYGGDGRSQIVVNTNGTYALTDTLLYAGSGITSLAASVHRHSLEQAAQAASRRLATLGALSIAEVCQNTCPQAISKVCGGGNIPNRGKGGNFHNPSVLCGDMGKMISDVYGLATALTHDTSRDRAVEELLPDIAY